MPEAGCRSAADVLHHLRTVERTLVVPLMARAWAARWQLDDEVDARAPRVLAALGLSVPDWPDWTTWPWILWRTRVFRHWARDFFAQHPAALGLNLGAGLSDYYQWLNNHANRWIDADLPAVMQLRERYLRPNSDAQALVLDIQAHDCWQRVQASDRRASGSPCWVMLEGVLMYWTPSQVRRFLLHLARHAPVDSRLAFDIVPEWMVGWPVHVPSVPGQAARFRWGVREVSELAAIHPRLQVAQVMFPPWPWAPAAWPGGDTPTAWPAMLPYGLVEMRVR